MKSLEKILLVVALAPILAFGVYTGSIFIANNYITRLKYQVAEQEKENIINGVTVRVERYALKFQNPLSSK